MNAETSWEREAVASDVQAEIAESKFRLVEEEARKALTAHGYELVDNNGMLVYQQKATAGWRAADLYFDSYFDAANRLIGNWW